MKNIQGVIQHNSQGLQIYEMCERKKKSESIHSGQFMVSHIENNDEEDVEADKIDEMLADAEEVVTQSPSSTDLQVYHQHHPHNQLVLHQPMQYAVANRTLESGDLRSIIDNDLSKVFDTLNVTYTQKLTSPKWNPFKGIRLRWKEKIRLNNVIWRCWHMQFVLKKKFVACQFASPLEVDIHKQPATILLEGKYWKRQESVISNEYKRWRRYNVKAIEAPNNIDSNSELDVLEWTSQNFFDNFTNLSDGMSSDTLFTTLSQIPFPDSREIARAGRADFIQPTLTPLGPSFQDIVDDLEPLLFNNSRLPPVPEEETTEVFKALDCHYPMIDHPHHNTASMAQGIISGSNTDPDNAPMSVDSTSTEPDQAYTASGQQQQQQNSQILYPINAPQQTSSITTLDTLAGVQPVDVQQGGGGANSQYSLKHKVPRGYYKQHRRETINYDKQQPTKHQTIIYNQLLAQQQQGPPPPPPQQQQIQQPQVQAVQQAPQVATLNVQCYATGPHQQFSPPMRCPIQTTTNNYNNNQQLNHQNQVLADVINLSNPQLVLLSPREQQQQQQQQPPQQQQQQIIQQPVTIIQNTNYKPPIYASYHEAPSPPRTDMYMQTQSVIAAKEMLRSNSLPINATMQSSFPQAVGMKDESFAVPRSHPRSSSRPSRHRSNSINLHKTANQVISGMQSANSEPVLNVASSALLAHLLTSNSNLVTNKTSSISSSAIGSSSSKVMSSSNLMQQQQQQQQPQAQCTIVNPMVSSGTMSSGSTGNISAAASVHTVNTAMQHKSLTFPAPAVVQNLTHHQSASTGMPTSVLTNLKMSLQQSSQQQQLQQQQQQQQPQQVKTPSAFSSTYKISTPSPPDSSLDVEMLSDGPNRGSKHVFSEQKRRVNIKYGFDTLHSLIPFLNDNHNSKVSKAAKLQKGAEYIRQLKSDREKLHVKMEALTAEIEALNNSISHLQTTLPANGAPVSRQRNGRVNELYQQYIRNRTMDNWKYWIFGLIFEPMMQSFNSTVSVASVEDLFRTTHNWVDQHCSLVELRPAVSNKLRILSTTTDLLADSPSSIQEEVHKAMSTASTSSSVSNSSGYQSR